MLKVRIWSNITLGRIVILNKAHNTKIQNIISQASTISHRNT